MILSIAQQVAGAFVEQTPEKETESGRPALQQQHSPETLERLQQQQLQQQQMAIGL